ncbi:MAG: PTS fructose transporter subunit IIA [Planctomycetota bacterium]|nr:MAG: PTS fructose transporter subunit IIA [Planctomycetota bacterium]
MMRKGTPVEGLLGFLSEEVIRLDLKARDKPGVIAELVDILVAAGRLAKEDRDHVVELVQKREQLGSTGIGHGLAIPHVKACDRVQALVGAFGRSLAGIDYHAIDGEPCRLFFLMISPQQGSAAQLRVLQKIAGLARNERFVKFLSEARNEAEVLALLSEVAEG